MARTGRPPKYPTELTLEWIEAQSTVNAETGCWLWNGVLHNGRPVAGHWHGYIHRQALRLKQGFINQYACHTCDNYRCVNPDHLYDGTQSQNMIDVSQRSPRNDYCRKLTVEEVKEIRAKYAKHGSLTALALEYRVGAPNIHAIVNRRSWRHV